MLKTLQIFCRSVTIVLILLMLTMLIVTNSLVITRYFFSYSPPWTEELTRYCMVWMTMLGAGALVLFEDHIALYMVVDKLPPRLRSLQKMFSRAVVFASGVLITWTGFKFSFGMHDVAAIGLQTTMLVPTLAIPLGAVMMTLFSILHIVRPGVEKIIGRKLVLPDQRAYMDSTFKSAEDDDGTGKAPTHQGEVS